VSAPQPSDLARMQPAGRTDVPAAGAAAVAPRTLAARVQSAGAMVTNVWLPRLSWSIGRTGRPGLVGLALLAASALFYVSTQMPVTAEIEQQRADLLAAAARPVVTAAQAAAADPLQGLRHLPARGDVPQVLGQLLKQADAAKLSIDTAKYEISTTKAGSLVRYRLSFPVSGTYPQIRQFIDATLVAIPALAVDEIAIARKSIGDEAVEAQVRMTIFTKGGS